MQRLEIGETRRRQVDRASRESTLLFIETLVAAVFGVRAEELRRKSRGRAEVAFARQTAMYLAHVSLGLSLSDVGDLFGRDRTTVAHACARIEDSRDREQLGRLLDCLEAAVYKWPPIFLAGSAFLPRGHRHDAPIPRRGAEAAAAAAQRSTDPADGGRGRFL